MDISADRDEFLSPKCISCPTGSRMVRCPTRIFCKSRKIMFLQIFWTTLDDISLVVIIVSSQDYNKSIPTTFCNPESEKFYSQHNTFFINNTFFVILIYL